MSFTRLAINLATCGFFLIAWQGPSEGQPLGEQIDQDRLKVRQDSQQLRLDAREVNQDNQSTRDYIQQTQSWIQDADMQAQAKQQQLSALESQQKSKAMIDKLLNTPGNQMYILNCWLNNEANLRAQAQANLNAALAKLRSTESQLAQDRYQLNADASSVQHDTGIFRQEMDQNADAWRQVQQGRYARGRHSYYTNFAESAYDAGRYNMGRGTWGAGPREPQREAQ